MEFPSPFSHHHNNNNNNRYVPHHPPPSFPDDHRHNPYPHHHLPPPPPPPPFHPPPPPPPSYPPLPLPPPPPPHHQSQFTYLPHHRQLSPPPPRVLNRTLFEDDHLLPRIRLPEFDLPYPDPRPEHHRPTRPIDFDHDLPPTHLHRHVSPYRPTDKLDFDSRRTISSSRFLDDDYVIDKYRGSQSYQDRDRADRQPLWGRIGDDFYDDDDNYDRGQRGDIYIPNLERSRNFEFGVDSHYSNEIFWNNHNRDVDRRWGHQARPRSRELPDSPRGNENIEFGNGDGVPFVSTRKVQQQQQQQHVYDSDKFNKRVRERESSNEFVYSPMKQVQKKSALLRIGKPNSTRNKSHDQSYSKGGYYDDSNASSFRGKDKDKDPVVYSDQRIQVESSKESPVELDVSFKSNALVAKAILPPSSPVFEWNLEPRNRKIRKPTAAGPSRVPSVKPDSFTHGSECPSSDITLKQFPEKVTVSGNGSACGVGSFPCSSGTHDSTGNIVVKGSPKVTVSDQAGNNGGSVGTPSPSRVRKKLKIASLISLPSSLQPSEKDSELVKENRSSHSPSPPNQGVMHSKEQTSVVSIPSLDELPENKVDDSALHMVSVKGDADSDSNRSRVLDSQVNYSCNFMGSSSPLDMDISDGSENEAHRSVEDLHFFSNFNEVVTELQNGSTICDSDRMHDVSPQPCQDDGVPLLLENVIAKGSSDGLVPVEGNDNTDLSSPEDIKLSKSPVESHPSAGDACEAVRSDFGFTKSWENITVSTDHGDGAIKQSALNEVTAPLENVTLEGSLDVVPLVGLSNAEESIIPVGPSNADSSNRAQSSTSSSNSSFTNIQGNNIVSNSCFVDDTSNQAFFDGTSILLENDLVQNVLAVGNPNVLSGTPEVKRKREVNNIQLHSSPRVSDTPVNVFSSALDEDTTLSCFVKDHVSTEEDVNRLGVGSSYLSSQPCKDGDGTSFLHGNRSPQESSEIDLSVRGGVYDVTTGTSPKYSKKRKVFVPQEKHSPESGTLAPVPIVGSGHALVTDLSKNTRTEIFPSHDTNKAPLPLNHVKENLRGKQPSSAAPRVVTARSSSVFSRKTVPINHNLNPRTWHRTRNASVSPLPEKKPYSNPVPPQRLPPAEVGKIQSSYVRKGNSLVRKPTPVTTLSRGFPALSSSVYRLNHSGIAENKKTSGSDSRLIDPPNCLNAVPSALSERPKTPPLPGSSKLLNCANSEDITSSSFAHFPHNDHPETTLAPLEPTENVDVPKFYEETPRSSETPECQPGPSSGSQKVVDERNLEKKITYVKRKSNQLVATSNSADLSLQDVDKNQASSCDSYYKNKKNQIIRTSGESHIKERGSIPKIISSRSSSKRQFGRGLPKMYKSSRSSLVWTLCNAQTSRKADNPLQRHKLWPHLFPWKRATYWRSFMHGSASAPNTNSLSTTSQKLLLSRKRETIYTRSTHGFSLRMSKLLSVGGSSLKWSKSIEKNSKKANEEATLAVAAAEKKKREQNGTDCGVARAESRNQYLRERIYRIGTVRYKMDPTRRTLQRISDEKPSCSASLQPEKNAKKTYVPRRLLIGKDEYVRIGNGNQLVRDPKKRTRALASEKVRWSLHTARLRLARKRKYCQFFTRFGKCNKEDGKCPYIHDPSKIAVCTKFLNGSCTNSNCKLTHKVIPERMQDCSYFLQGLCSNQGCPYRHVNVNPNAAICEGFLKGYCATGNECRKKHTYVCPVFEATGNCLQGSKCKLHHPKNRSKGMRKPSREQKSTRGRYFGSEVAKCTSVSEKNYIKGEEDNIFLQEGKFVDFISLGTSDEEAEETSDPTSEERIVCDIAPSDLQVTDLDELTKPVLVMHGNLKAESSLVDSSSEKTASLFSEESNCCK